MIRINQLRQYVIRPALHKLELYSEAAEELLVGTALQESLAGTYLEQLGEGIQARGLFQMEENTFYKLHAWYKNRKPMYLERVIKTLGYKDFPHIDRLITDLEFAAMMARLLYFHISTALPEATDINGLASYWKKYYNTIHGRGKISEFIEKYNRYAKDS